MMMLIVVLYHVVGLIRGSMMGWDSSGRCRRDARWQRSTTTGRVTQRVHRTAAGRSVDSCTGHTLGGTRWHCGMNDGARPVTQQII